MNFIIMLKVMFTMLNIQIFLNGVEESFYISDKDYDVIKVDYISNVYTKILEYVDKGLVKIRYFTEQ